MATYTWIGPTGGTWNTATNWSGGTAGTVPGSADTATIGTAGAVSNSPTDTIGTLTLNGTATFEIASTFTLGTLLTIGAGTLQLSAAQIQGLGDITNNGAITVLPGNSRIYFTTAVRTTTNNGTLTVGNG